MSPRRYPTRPLVGIGACIWRDDCVLLIQRGRAPAQGNWSLPGGAQKLGETAEDAARRELLEETGIEAGPLRLLAVLDSLQHDPAGRLEYHYTIIDYTGPWRAGEARPGGDSLAARFVPANMLDTYALSPTLLALIDQARPRRA